MTLKETILKNRSTRGFDRSRVVTEEELREMIDCARVSAASMNQQPLCFYMSNDEEQCLRINDNVMFGGSLRELNLPYAGTEPMAFIAICHDLRINDSPDRFLKDVGIYAQSITLAATEMGLNGLMIGAYNPEKMREVLGLPDYYVVQLVIAIGKSAEEIHLIDVDTPEPPAVEGQIAPGSDASRALGDYRKEYLASVKYYREGNVHFTPKRKLDDIILK